MMRGGGEPPIRDFKLLVILFVVFRLGLLLVFEPAETRGITFMGDYQHYYNVAALSDRGFYPYRDYWYEFPPVFPLVNLAIYRGLAARGPVEYADYAMLLGFVMLAFDAGNLILLNKIGEATVGKVSTRGIVWVYAVLLAPLVFTYWTFESMAAFFLLLAIYFFITKDEEKSAAAAAIGVLVKFVPAILIAAVWRYRSEIWTWRLWNSPLKFIIRSKALRFTQIFLGIIIVVLVPLVLLTGELGIASLTAQFNKASYQTVWALIDGNYRTGNFGGLAEHFDAAKAYDLLGNPAKIPSWLRLIIFGGIGLAVFLSKLRDDRRGEVAFVTFTLFVFFLWAQGWSPQWLMMILPLILLNFPNREGVFVCLILNLLSFIEYPWLFARTGATGGEIVGAMRGLYAAVVIARTLILAWVTVSLYGLLRDKEGT